MLAYLNGDKCEFFKSQVSNPSKSIRCVDLFHIKEILQKKKNLITLQQVWQRITCHIFNKEQPASTIKKHMSKRDTEK